MPRSCKNDLLRHGRRRAALPPELRRVNVNAAGIDIGAGQHYVAVPEGRDPQGRAVRQFGCFTDNLCALADWLWQCGLVAKLHTGQGPHGCYRGGPISFVGALGRAALYPVNLRVTSGLAPLPSRSTVPDPPPVDDSDHSATVDRGAT